MTHTSEMVIARLESLAEQVRLGGDPIAEGPSPLVIPILISYEFDDSEGVGWSWEIGFGLPLEDIERSAATPAQLLDDVPESGETVDSTPRHRHIAQQFERLADIIQAVPPASGWSSPIYGIVEVSYMFSERQDGNPEATGEDWHWDLEVAHPGQGAFIGTGKDLETLFEAAFLRYGISTTK